MTYNGHKDHKTWDVCNEACNEYWFLLEEVVEDFPEDEQVKVAMKRLPAQTKSGTTYTKERVEAALEGVRDE